MSDAWVGLPSIMGTQHGYIGCKYREAGQDVQVGCVAMMDNQD